jgi:hypothetical protein
MTTQVRNNPTDNATVEPVRMAKRKPSGRIVILKENRVFRTC